VVLRVELDEQGRISNAEVATSSGSPRLDEAALNAVKEWRCTAARRDGVPARAVALQPFNFKLR
jgi:protein TonB